MDARPSLMTFAAAVVRHEPVELVQLLHQSPSKWFSDLVLNWRIPPAR